MDDNKKNRKSLINTWKPKKNENLVENDGKLFIIHFDKIFYQPNLKVYNTFMIKKTSYENQLDIISKYIYFFMSIYDTDNELATAYLRIKFDLDNRKLFSKDDFEALIDEVYELIFTPKMCEKINNMVEENYLDDIESGDDKQSYKKANKQYLESLEFTNEHIKILLKISFGMKVISPILFHYFALNVIKLEKNDDRMYLFYKRLFPLFSGECNIYNKLYVYVKTKVLDSFSHNSTIFEQREIFGVDIFSVIDEFVKKVIISENMVKYKFNEHYDSKLHKYKENIVGFNKTIIKFQLSYFLRVQYSKTLTEVSNTKNAEGLSGADKMEMNLSKIDEGRTTLIDININQTIETLKKENDIPISEEEIDYYVKNHKPSELQINLVKNYYAKYFDSCRELSLVTRREYITLMLILKKILILNAGYDKESGYYNDTFLPYIISGNLEERVNTRIIRNTKKCKKINENSIYDKLINEKYTIVEQIKQKYIMQMISTILNTRFTYVVYENPDLLGKEIEYDEDVLSDEILSFFNQI